LCTNVTEGTILFKILHDKVFEFVKLFHFFEFLINYELYD